MKMTTLNRSAKGTESHSEPRLLAEAVSGVLMLRIPRPEHRRYLPVRTVQSLKAPGVARRVATLLHVRQGVLYDWRRRLKRAPMWQITRIKACIELCCGEEKANSWRT